MSKINIVRPTHPPLEDFEDAFNEILESGCVTNNGPWVESFETALTDYLGAPTIVFNNGQSALMAMLKAADMSPGEIICPSFTFVGTPAAIEWAGHQPKFVEIDPETLCIDPAAAERAIGPRTRAILGVDAYGICCDSNELMATRMRDDLNFGRPRLNVFIDSAPSFGSSKGGKLTGMADAQIFSFHATKAFSTMEGGALCSLDCGILERARCIRNFGQSIDGDCGIVGFNGKMLEICAIIGVHQLKNWKETSSERFSAAEMLAEKLDGIPGLKVVGTPDNQRPIWLYRPILIDEPIFGMSRDAVVLALKRFDIHVRKYYTACHQLSYYQKSNIKLPLTEFAAKNVISLPVYNDMKISEIDRIASALRNLQSGGGY